MPIIRTAQPVPVSVPGLQIATLATATAMPIGLSRDTTTVFGSANGGLSGTANVLYQSVDDGTTWTTVYTFSSSERVQGIRETDDGEALVITQATAASPGYLYKSTGWTTSHTTATWTKVLTSIGGYFRAYWSGGHTWSFGDDTISAGTSKIGIVTEYGGQTTASGDQTTMARRAYLTQDYGATWTQILDVYTRYSTPTQVINMHVHFGAYDPYWNRIWILIGDNFAAEGTPNYPILYSDDLGVTFTAVPAQAPWGNGGSFFQSTNMAILPDSIIFGNDNAPGFLRLSRRGYRKLGPIDNPVAIAGHTGAQMIATGVHQNRRQPGASVLLSVFTAASTLAPAIYASLDGGNSIQKLWADIPNAANGNQVLAVVGPTSRGKVLAHEMVGSTNYLLVGEIIDPGPNLKVGAGTVTGDGTTTVFTFPHGLGIAPSRFSAWQEKPAATYTLSADATNVIVTFTAAPANAASIPFQWRAGA